VFTLVTPRSWGGRRVHAAAAPPQRHAPNTAFAGYAAGHADAIDLVARFRVPGVTCAKRESAIGPGAFLLSGPASRLAFSSANLIVGCFRGQANAQEAIEVNGVEFDFVRAVQPGDRIVARLIDTPGGRTLVQLRDLNPRRRFVLTRSGRGLMPAAELVGDWASADVKTGNQVPPPDFQATTFRGISVNGHPFGSAAATGFDMASSGNVLQISASPLRGTPRNRFTCRRRFPRR